MAVGKSKKTGSCSIIECRTCKMWVDLESCKGLTEMSQSERSKLVFDCWKCMVDERVKMAEVNMKKEEEIKRLKAEVVFLKRELENGRKLKGEEDVRSKRRVDGDGNDSMRRVGKFDDLAEEFEKGRLECVGVVETQMQDRVRLVCKENKYQMIGKGCVKWQKKGGGVGLIVKNALNWKKFVWEMNLRVKIFW
ncbi:hypothetical protein FHG87_025700 [Trinorchestia longiramus]|nr:hypothetical protein FHG87_025700 [Trinorchestia longiramus]